MRTNRDVLRVFDPVGETFHFEVPLPGGASPPLAPLVFEGDGAESFEPLVNYAVRVDFDGEVFAVRSHLVGDDFGPAVHRPILNVMVGDGCDSSIGEHDITEHDERPASGV